MRLRDELTRLNRLSRSLHRERELEPLLDRLLETVTGELGFGGAGVLFRGVAGVALAWRRFARAADRSRGLRDIRNTPPSAPRFLQRLGHGETQLLTREEGRELEAPLRHWPGAVAAEQMLVVPLVGRNRVLGALAVDNRRGGPSFSDDDRARLEVLVHQSALAIENIRFVDDLRRLRAPSPRADRLAALGRLAAGVAHEIHNPLVSVHTFLQMARSKRLEADDEFWTEYHALACREADRIRRLVDSMARLEPRCAAPPGRAEVFDPGALAGDVVTLLRDEADRAQVMLTLERDPETPKIRAVQSEIQQVFLHLLRNAIHASPERAEVRVRVFSDRGGDAVGVEVNDRGAGISEEDLERIFDPFFTTRAPGGGPGLGLMTCHRIVSDHGGSIQVRSREGQGASFCLRLPCGIRAGQERSDRVGLTGRSVGYSRATGVGDDPAGASLPRQE
ncbi:MAG: ATP-binding protein [Myxococcota bacterium]